MGEFLTQENHDRAIKWNDPGACAVMIVCVQDKFAGIAVRPSGVQVGDHRQHPIGLAAKGVIVPLVVVAGSVMGEVALKGEQAQEQPPVEKIL